jgi:anti-sigma-K factor RskA
MPQLPPLAANTNTVRRPVPRWTAIAASVLVALGVGYFGGQALTPDVPRPTMVAVLINEGDQSPGAIIEAFGDDSVRIVPLVDFAVPDGSVLEVWTLPDPDTGPVSLGTLDAAADIRLRGPDLPLPADGQLYEITLEPAPRSPTGRPTGPILVKGFAKAPI